MRSGFLWEHRQPLLSGGARGTLWRQITADMLGLTLVTAKSSDSSLGAAMLAGVAVGIFGSREDAVERCVRQKGDNRF